MRRSSSVRRSQLNVVPLEERATPAFVGYSAGTMTVWANDGDAIAISPDGSGIAGHVKVVVGANTVANNQPVKWLVVNYGAAKHYSLDVSGVTLNSLTVNGAPGSTDITIEGDTHVTGNLMILGNAAGTGDDNVTLQNGVIVGKNASIKLRDGENHINVDGGTIGGTLTLGGGAGNDWIKLANTGNLAIGTDLNMAFGAGHNLTSSDGDNLISVGRNWTYAGSTGTDRLPMSGFGTQIWVGGNVTVNFGATAAADEQWSNDAMFVGGNFKVMGGDQKEKVWFSGDTTIGGNVSVNFGGGRGEFNSGLFGGGSSKIGGNLTVVGKNSLDFGLDHLIVGGDVNVTSGPEASMADMVRIGISQVAPVIVDGALNIHTNSGADTIDIMRLHVGEGFTLSTGGGADQVQIDDSEFLGPTLIDLGGGADNLEIDCRFKDANGFNLNDPTQFQDNLTVQAGDGDDSVNFSDLTGTRVIVGGNLKLVGGLGGDMFVHDAAANKYLGTKFEDFEGGEAL
ncbi:MAG TPA: hypothetical protein VHR66_03255 [Gemmataceae bacterium]|jgi:hypothetical protein|nr:hypothetical protein [Gemmataceae bacterium]